MSKLSKREKVLIWFMIILMVTFGLVFLIIKPYVASYNELILKRDTLRDKKQEMSININAYQMINDSYSENMNEIVNTTKQFAKQKQDVEFEKMFSDRAKNFAINIEKFYFNELPLETMDLADEESEVKDENLAINNIITAVNIDVTAIGDKAELIRYISSYENDKVFKLTSLNITGEDINQSVLTAQFLFVMQK